MGQAISVTSTIVGDAAIFDANRSISGQDGRGFSSLSEAEAGDTYPAKLAADLFSSDRRITTVFVGSNGIVSTREGGWDDEATENARRTIERFFVFYRD